MLHTADNGIRQPSKVQHSHKNTSHANHYVTDSTSVIANYV